MARSRRWLLLPIVLAAAIWFAWTRERASEGRAGAGDSASTNSVDSELARPEDRDESDGASGSDRVPAQDTTSGARAERSVSVRLHVLEQGSRRPIPGAIVQAFEREFETDAQGACEIQWPEAKAQSSPGFHVAKAGFVHLWTWLYLEPELEVTLSRAATLSGRVLADDTGAPVAGARLFVAPKVALTHCRCPVEIVESDPSGRYELPGVTPRDGASIVIQAEGFSRLERDFELRSDEARIEQDFRLERGVEIAGRVVDFTSGAGLPGALVAGFPADDAGRFRSWVAVERAGEVRVRVSAPGHCLLDARYDREVLERTGALELRLPRSVAVEGIFRDPAGNPLAGASIFALQYDSDGPPADDPARDELPARWTLESESDGDAAASDAAGRFRIEGLVPWSRTTWISAAWDLQRPVKQRVENTGAPGSTSWLELVLPPEQPSNATKLWGEVSVNGLEGRWPGNLSWKGPTREGRVELRDGFHIEVEPGEVRFHVALDAVPGPIEGDSFVLELAPGTNTHHDVVLKLPPAPLRGRVRFDDGTPIPQTVVTVNTVSDRGPEYSWARSKTESDSAGAFQLDVPDLGMAYRIEASFAHQSAILPSVAAGATDLELVFSRPAKVLFRVRDVRTGARLDLDMCTFRWRRSGDAEFAPWDVGFADADLDGWFEDELPAGWLDLEVRRPWGDYLPLLLERVRIPDGPDPARIEFPLDPGLAVRLQFAEGQEAWPTGHALLLVEEEFLDEFLAGSLAHMHGADLQEQGGTVQGLAPGRYRVLVSPEELTIEPAEIVLPVKENEPVIVRWKRR